MKIPVRWLDAGTDAPKGAAELLSAAAPPPEFSAALRYRLALGVAKTAATPVAATWMSSLLAKGALVAVIGGGSGLLVHAIASRQEPAPVVAPSSPVTPAVVATKQVEPPPVAVDALPALQLPTAPVSAPRLKLDPRLEEAELLEKARSLIGSNPAQALKLTAEHSRDFPRGRLGAEADLLAAQALLGLGNTAAAKQRAEASLKRYPKGLYARQLREIIDR